MQLSMQSIYTTTVTTALRLQVSVLAGSECLNERLNELFQKLLQQFLQEAVFKSEDRVSPLLPNSLSLHKSLLSHRNC